MTRPSLAAALLSSLAFVGVACKEEPPRDAEPSSPAPSSSPPSSSPAAASPPAAAAHGAITFLADDWAEAKRRAASSGKLIFVDAWAPWCHTCWSMKREVLHDEKLAPYLESYVFLEVDTDRPANAAFTTQFPVKLWPTFFVIEPTSEAIVAVQGGSMSLEETVAFLERGKAARSGGAPADEALREGYASWKAGAPAKAAEHFKAAAKHEGARQSEAIGAAIGALRHAKDWAGCTSFALAHLEILKGSAAVGDNASLMLLCSSKLDDGHALKEKARTAARAKLEALVAQPAAGASVDDRAGVMAELADLYEATGDKEGARALHEQRLALMEADAKAASSPEAARVHDYARMNSYFALGRGEQAVAMFEERVRQLPDDYEAHARLASSLYQLQRYQEAGEAVSKAIELSYGPRRLRYYKLLADIRSAQDDREGRRAALKELLAANDALPEALRLNDLAEAARAAMGSAP